MVCVVCLSVPPRAQMLTGVTPERSDGVFFLDPELAKSKSYLRHSIKRKVAVTLADSIMAIVANIKSLFAMYETRKYFASDTEYTEKPGNSLIEIY
ncbi:hypothetical protein CEXT_680051 [Caerostris extrusa]|uniref:Uncharacterized protein n=1 Tax=Caerostris extrusa TaxID=172846 RepID=A0AAV4VAW6_CAEEX|nr:hypothetical protein CEXT_680051 [Caerostris extrusa]